MSWLNEYPCRKWRMTYGEMMTLDRVMQKFENPKDQPAKPKPQDTDPHAPGYFPPYNDMGLVRTINNAVDCGWAYPSEEERKIMDKVTQ